MKTLFESKFGINPHPIKDKPLYFSIQLFEEPYSKMGLSYVQFFIKHQKIKVEYKKSTTPISSFFIKGIHEPINFESPIYYEIILSKVPTNILNPNFLNYLSKCILINFSDEFNPKIVTYFNSFEQITESKKLNLSSLNIKIILKNNLNRYHFNDIFLNKLEEKLTSFNLTLATITFNDLFNLSFTKDESKWLTELIVYKTKTEEIYESLENKIDFAIELMNQIEEKTSIFYQNYPEKVIKNHINISENVAIFINK